MDNEKRLYGELAWLWPVISPPSEHVKENEEFSRIIQSNCLDRPATLLHLGCGGGHDDFTLKKHFKVTGVDISESMLQMARRLNPEADYHHGDMKTVRLDKTFDSVVIGDSIGYMLSRDDLFSVFQTAFVHLRPGGIMLTLAEETSESFQEKKTLCSNHIQGNVEVTFIQNYYDPDRQDTTYEVTLIFLIRRNGQLTVEVDRHTLGLFHINTWLELLREMGFGVEQTEFRAWDVEERIYPLLIGKKPFRVGDRLT